MINDGTSALRFDFDKSGAYYGALADVFKNPLELLYYSVLRRIYS
jgi:hypothetical protein